METHICVMQTALGALNEGYLVHVASDAIGSRVRWNWDIGIDRMRAAGAVISTTEMMIYELLRSSGTRAIQADAALSEGLIVHRVFPIRLQPEYPRTSMISLARKLRLADFFSLGFGTMIGVGWLVVMDDWLLRGGPLGAVLGFAIGGALLLPIGYVYGQLVRAMPDAAGEIAYTAAVFPRSVSFATGWMMLLAYYIVCPWEAVAIGTDRQLHLPRHELV